MERFIRIKMELILIIAVILFSMVIISCETPPTMIHAPRVIPSEEWNRFNQSHNYKRIVRDEIKEWMHEGIEIIHPEGLVFIEL